MIDFFNLQEKADDPEVKKWLKEPKNMLLAELFWAEQEARKGGKRKTQDAHRFEANLYENLIILRDSLWDYSYRPSRGTVHVVKNPVTREIFAAPFVDRIVHHWIVMQLIDWWEKRLNNGSCSCRVGRGTSFGINLLDKNIRRVSHNFKDECYIIKFDIRGYFMHIVRKFLFERVEWGLKRQFAGQMDDKRCKILRHAISAVIFDNPVDGVRMQGSIEDWRMVPEDKSLFVQPPGLGIVIGNLTSQFFSNIYLDFLDRYITIELGYKYYVRYVDDFCIIIRPDELPKAKTDIARINTFLNGLGLELNMKKTRVLNSHQGVPFLGMVIRDGAIMPGKRMVRNFSKTVYLVETDRKSVDSVISYLGMLVHYDAGKVCDKIFTGVGWEYSR